MGRRVLTGAPLPVCPLARNLRVEELEGGLALPLGLHRGRRERAAVGVEGERIAAEHLAHEEPAVLDEGAAVELAGALELDAGAAAPRECQKRRIRLRPASLEQRRRGPR